MIDLAQIRVISGHGGNGAVSYRREKFVPRGGPDGGDGGRGGDIVIVADEGLTTLAHFRHMRVYKAEAGKPGTGAHRRGGNGLPLQIKVPLGTEVRINGTELAWDVDHAGMQVIIAQGGDGGRGNARFANSIRQAPNFAEKGMPSEDFDLELELKLLADVGLVGLPNAGKSTLLRVISHARPDVADFPFTTLEPVLGVVDMGMEGFVVADLPGLIEGAHAGVGLGHQFLRHVERTRVLVHLIDASSEDPMADYKTIRNELALYDASLAAKPEVVVFNKIDMTEARARAVELEPRFNEGQTVLHISGATGEAVQPLLQHLARLIRQTAPAVAASEEKEMPILRPAERARLDVSEEDGVFVVRGRHAEEAALKLGESGSEALDELQDRLRQMGLERALRRAGARPGATLRIRNVELEWHG